MTCLQRVMKAEMKQYYVSVSHVTKCLWPRSLGSLQLLQPLTETTVK